MRRVRAVAPLPTTFLSERFTSISNPVGADPPPYTCRQREDSERCTSSTLHSKTEGHRPLRKKSQSISPTRVITTRRAATKSPMSCTAQGTKGKTRRL